MAAIVAFSYPSMTVPLRIKGQEHKSAVGVLMLLQALGRRNSGGEEMWFADGHSQLGYLKAWTGISKTDLYSHVVQLVRDMYTAVHL